MNKSHWFRSGQKSAKGSCGYGVHAALVLVAVLVFVGATCGAVYALVPPTDKPTEPISPPAQMWVGPNAETSQASATTTTTTVSAADEYPDYRPDPVRSSTPLAQSIGARAEASLAGAELRLVEAVEFIFPDGTGPVFDIMLQSESTGPTRAFVRIFIQKTLRQLKASDISAEDEMAASQMKIPDYGVEEASLAGASRAYCVTGPFGSYVQIVAELTNGMTINVCSASGEVKGTPPLDMAGVERLTSVLAQEF